MNLPQCDFYLREDGEFVIKTTRDLVVGKRSVIFLVPGAFTPTCTNQQLPGFEAAYDQITAKSVDQILCVSVNDAFVMNAWAESLGIEKVKMIPDGNGAFTVGAKALVSKQNIGLGSRAWRCALIVNENGVVEWAGVEAGKRDNASDDPYEESTPVKVLEALEQIEALKKQAAEAEEKALAEAAA